MKTTLLAAILAALITTGAEAKFANRAALSAWSGHSLNCCGAETARGTKADKPAKPNKSRKSRKNRK